MLKITFTETPLGILAEIHGDEPRDRQLGTISNVAISGLYGLLSDILKQHSPCEEKGCTVEEVILPILATIKKTTKV